MEQVKGFVRTFGARSKKFWKHHVSGFKRLKSWQQLVSLGLLIMVVSLVGWRTAASQSSAPEALYYQKRLQAIHTSITDIKIGLSERETLTDPKLLPDHYKDLDTIIDSCSDIIKRAKNPAQDLKDKIEKSAKLCQDLLAVASYQKNLYTQLEVVVNVDTHKLPRPDEANARLAVNNIHDNISRVRANLKRMVNARFKDPAAGEIDILLARLNEQTVSLQSQNQLDPAAYNKLLRSIDDTRMDLLLRRGYFWRTTAEIDVLERVINSHMRAYQQ